MCLCFSYSGRQKIRSCVHALCCLNSKREEKLRRMSFFGSTFTFSLDGKKKYKTCLGGLISLVVLLTFFSSLSALTLHYMNSSMIGDIIKVTSFSEKFKFKLTDEIKLVFWFTGLVDGKVTSVPLKDVNKYFNVSSNYLNQFGDPTEKDRNVYVNPYSIKNSIVDCKDMEKIDPLVHKLIDECSMVGFKEIENKLCLKEGKKTLLNATKINQKDSKSKQNTLFFDVNLCTPSKQPECDANAIKNNKYFLNYVYNEKIIKIQEVGRNVTVWVKPQPMYDNDLIPVFSSHLLKDDNSRTLKVYVNFKKVYVNYTFENLALLIRKIPIIGMIFLKIFFDYDFDNPLRGYEKLRTDSNDSDKKWGGVNLRLNSYQHKEKYLISFISPMDFMFKVILGEVVSLSKIVVTVVMLFYGPYNRYKMKWHMKKKTVEQQNEVLPERYKLKGNEDDPKYKENFLKENPGKSWTEEDETKRLLGIAAMKNAEENLEFIDEIKTNIVQNEYMSQKLTASQRKLLPIAYVNKMAKEIEKGEKEEQLEDIVEVFRRFKNTEPDPNECDEMKKIREYILTNAAFIEDLDGDVNVK